MSGTGTARARGSGRARPAAELACLDHDLATGQDRLRLSRYLESLENRVVHVHAMCPRREQTLVRAGRRSRCPRRCQGRSCPCAGRARTSWPEWSTRPPPSARVIPLPPPRPGAAGPHPVLHDRQPIGNLGEIPSPELLLLGETERAVVGGHHGQVVGAQAPPQRCLVLLGPQRRRGHVLGALEAGSCQVVKREVQVLRAGLPTRSARCPWPG